MIRLRNVLFASACAMIGLSAAVRAAPPAPPVITEPPVDGFVVNAEDVHMETAPMDDPDGDGHDSTDWEILTAAPVEVVWNALDVTTLEKLHIHLGDGVFVGSHAGRTSLLTETSYVLRVKHRDTSMATSEPSLRAFATGAASQVFPLELRDVADAPLPTWRDETGASLFLPGQPAPGFLRLESPTGELFLGLVGINGSSNQIDNPGPLAMHAVVRVLLGGGGTTLTLPRSRVSFTNEAGIDRTIYLPSMSITAGSTAYFWISANGSSYWGTASQTEPNFSDLAQGAPVPWDVLVPGYKAEVVATGFKLPVNIAFVPNPGASPTDPSYYVTELYGTIKVVARNGVVSTYATNLLNFDPTGAFPGSGEQGLAGIVVDPASGDVFAGMMYDAAPPNGPHYPKVVRFHSADGGLTAASQTTILDMPGELQGQSHFVSSLSLGPDGKLYVHMGDGFDATTALNLSSYRGKILRVHLDGTSPSDNPFYNAGDGLNATDAIYAYGLRNPFGGTWRASDGFLYEVENGAATNDRFAKIVAGQSYGWNGTDGSMTTNAIYNWAVPHAPVNVAFIEASRFGGSGFPASAHDHAFVTESGPTYGSGRQNRGKRIVEFTLDGAGHVLEGPVSFVEYTGGGRATACGLAAGPDGLYFTDLYKDLGATPVDRGANVLRVRYLGTANFVANVRYGQPPLAVPFIDLSDVPGAASWLWYFGDGGTSAEPTPVHTYEAPGVYDVRLEVTGSNGTAVSQKNVYILVGDPAVGLQGDYYDNPDFTSHVQTRIDPVVNFSWGTSAPMPPMGSNSFSVRWTGRVEPAYGETYTFYTTNDDGVRLWVNDQLLIDSWSDGPVTEHSGTIALVAGQRVDIQMDYYDHLGEAMARLEWASPSRPRQVIPQSALFPALPPIGVGDAHAPAIGEGLVLRVPTPARQATLVRFALPASGRAALVLYDVGGREVETLFEGYVESTAEQRFVFDPTSHPSGVYFLRLSSGRTGVSRKLVVTP